MIRLCKYCNETKKTPYKDICRNCYQDKWSKSIPLKTCFLCFEKFNTAGKSCCKCKDKKRKSIQKKISCSQCHRKGLVFAIATKKLCTKCDRNNREILNPVLKIKRQEYNRLYSRKKKGKDLNDPIRRSKGFWKNKQGYIVAYQKNHPNANSNGCILMHKFVMSEYLKRPLKTNENIHHKNGIRDDNRIENLELWHKGQCSGQRLDEKLEWCKKLLEEYDFVVTKSKV